MANKVFQIATVTLMVGFLLTAFQNCGSSEDGMKANKAETSPDLDHLLKTLNGMAASDLSCAVDADCVALPVGDRPCSGPTDYLITSFRNIQYDQIDMLASQFTELQRQYNIDNRLAGTCDYQMPPTLKCLQTQCVSN